MGHLLWFKRVVYTNGIEWRFYSVDEKYVQQVLKEITPKTLVELQDDSYKKLAKKGIIYHEIDNILGCVCKNHSVEELMECEPFILRTISEDGTKLWNEVEWNRLIEYLDGYSVQ